jgi:hypothetical protein
MSGQLRAILWAQLRALRHYLAAGRGAAAVLSGLTLAVWYLLWIALAAACLWFAARPGSEAILAPYLSKVFFGVFVYWQAGPVVLGVSGASWISENCSPSPSRGASFSAWRFSCG